MTLSSATVSEDFGYVPPQYIWEVGPPATSDDIISFSGLQGLAFSLFVPIRIPDSSPEAIRKLREYGTLNLDLLQWNDFGEVLPYKEFRFKKENVMLNLIERQSPERLKVAYWLLDSLTRAKEVHLEESYRS